MKHIKKINIVIWKSPFSVLFDEEVVQLDLGVCGRRYPSQHYPSDSEFP